jgi:hypothetical protein
MQTSWYLLFIRPEDADAPPRAPMVGEKVCHILGQSEDADQQKRDKENGLWSKIQDGIRPAWSPDLLRLGYTVVFARDALPKLAAQLQIKNPVKLKQEKGGIPPSMGGKRVLTFDDVWVVGVEPERSPFYMPPLDKDDEDWWLATRDMPKVTSPFIAPGGAKVMLGMQRMADVVAEMMATPSGYPRTQPPTENDPGDLDTWGEVDNPLLQRVGDLPNQGEQPETNPGPGGGFASTPLFRGY